MNMQKRAKKFVKGLRISWEDKTPLEFSTGTMNGKVTHKNPILRHCASDIMAAAPEWILSKAQLTWRVTAILVFEYKTVTQREERIFNYRGRLCEMNETFCKEIKTAMKYGENYSHTEITVECVGL